MGTNYADPSTLSFDLSATTYAPDTNQSMNPRTNASIVGLDTRFLQNIDQQIVNELGSARSDEADMSTLSSDLATSPADLHTKRKGSTDSLENADSQAKRREGRRVPRKPGRKPILDELPPTKRKAQNRAAQRAFRERKEQHVKDLEDKVEQLTKSSEKNKQVNSLLKSQIQRLENQLSAQGTGQLYAPAVRNNFYFDVPQFGQSQITPPPDAGQNLHGILPKHDSASPIDFSVSSSSVPKGNVLDQSFMSHPAPNIPVESQYNGSTQAQAFAPGLTQSPPAMDSFAGLFSPSLINAAGQSGVGSDYGFQSAPSRTSSLQSQSHGQVHDSGTDSNSGLTRVFRFNSSSGATTSQSESPSLSPFHNISSTATSPEPLSATTAPKPVDARPTGDIAGLATSALSQTMAEPATTSLDRLVSQNNGQFDPVLLGDYRESQDAIIGDGDFNNGFFDDAFLYDMSSPFNAGLGMTSKPQTPGLAAAYQTHMPAATASQKLLQQLDKPVEYEHHTSSGTTVSAAPTHIDLGSEAQPKTGEEMMTCDAVWRKLQAISDFKEGKLDLDLLCDEMRAKVTCTETGMLMPAHAVTEALEKMNSHRPVKAEPST